MYCTYNILLCCYQYGCCVTESQLSTYTAAGGGDASRCFSVAPKRDSECLSSTRMIPGSGRNSPVKLLDRWAGTGVTVGPFSPPVVGLGVLCAIAGNASVDPRVIGRLSTVLLAAGGGTSYDLQITKVVKNKNK